ncbi:hypothetical protein OAM26_04655 [Porticoccaceae bacterium]|nr:hypothetical protein [Porticoccaceae bacterium]
MQLSVHCLVLKALGVVQYLPRDSWKIAAVAQNAAVRPTAVTAPAAEALLAQLESAPVAAAERSKKTDNISEVAAPVAEPIAATPAQTQPLQPLKLALWQAGEEWLFIADVSSQLPTSAELKLLANIARSLQTSPLAALELIEWPLPGAGVAPREDSSGHEFLSVLFDARFQNRPTQKVVWLASSDAIDLAAVIGAQAMASMAGLVQLQIPSLARMLSDPTLKAQSWARLCPYVVPSQSV